jgi:hypothetical protein
MNELSDTEKLDILIHQVGLLTEGIVELRILVTEGFAELKAIAERQERNIERQERNIDRLVGVVELLIERDRQNREA